MGGLCEPLGAFRPPDGFGLLAAGYAAEAVLRAWGEKARYFSPVVDGRGGPMEGA
jgi:hypothetical protein